MIYNNTIIDMADVIADQGFYFPGDAIYIPHITTSIQICRGEIFLSVWV